MKKSKLFTALAAVTLLASAGTQLTVNNQVAVHAATKKAKKTTKKNSTSSRAIKITVKKNAAAYEYKSKKIVTYKLSGKKQVLRGGSASAFWSLKQGKTNYYYMGNIDVKSGKKTVSHMLFVKSSDAKVAKGKKVPTLDQYNAKYNPDYNKQIQVPVKNLPVDYFVSAKVNNDSEYFIGKDGTDGKTSFSKATDTIKAGTILNIAFKIDNALQDGNNNPIATYAAYIDNNGTTQLILLPVSVVTLDDTNAQIPDQAGFEAKVKDWQVRNDASRQQQVKDYLAKMKK